uniref:Uncharacterized protein n=1 Tax=Pyrodinium bahamense TaxID=73915 RepID=A0A7S0A4L2_9DINO|mmetsp:Transcript_21680/g.60164  ORF Transcript_21680/g.60164 Transcript_21680/m.60164 type:complete len:318 (+) Transcript_21680:126-1079(+)|eukprot:CAMPEP_0179037704 /NCGR_PEP_ID=MMETSP0796-20121207/14263_1 /TAXON_ID=73915 /ORGANISM="Pyrodinium bahamense, Strain pbaha01" /LENGTH=317 /DNA_ID=CAMNT_0020734015 /DNA_START=49 /DNA_END=1002 /DNA_ORIENTATION=-
MQPVVRWAVGVSAVCLKCLLSAAGFLMQRKAHLLERQGKGKKDSKPLLVGGIVAYLLGSFPDVVSYMLLPEVVCSTFSCLQLVVVAALAHVWLREHVRQREVLGMAVCLAGTALCLGFGPRPRALHSVDEQTVAVYVAAGLGLLAVGMLLDCTKDRCCWRGPWAQKACAFTLPMATGMAYALGRVFNTMLSFVEPPHNLPWGAVHEPLWATMLMAMGLLALTDLYLNMRGARQMPAQVYVPTSFALSTALQYFQSLVIFREFQHMGTRHAVLSVAGAFASLVGALCIQPPTEVLSESEHFMSRTEENSCLDHGVLGA